MKIYIDLTSKKEIDYELIENQSYVLDFEEMGEDLIAEEIRKSKLSEFIDWHCGNRYGRMCITNYIGNIYLFKKTYNVKSNKFLRELTGVEQFRKLLDIVGELSKNIVFSYDSPSFVLREIDYQNNTPSTLLMFNYFKTIILDWDSTNNLTSCINRVIKNPNFKYLKIHERDNIEKIKKIKNKTIQFLLKKTEEVVILDHDSTHLLDLPVTKFLSHNSSEKYFPTKTYVEKSKLSYDTLENRFVKYFIKYIVSLTYRLGTISNLPPSIDKERTLVLQVCQSLLNKPFFKQIGEMTVVPINSTVLHGRIGYKEILQHYYRSQFGILHFFAEFEKNALSIDLKKISDLYEYWIFYQVAIAFLGNSIRIEQQSVLTDEGDLSYGVCFKNEKISVYYNKTESRSRESSYSVTLRPDVTVSLRAKGEKDVKFIFDAKYKVDHKKGNGISIDGVQVADIHKMHTYVDAIKDTLFAIVVYPGTEFIFYDKSDASSIKRRVDDIVSFQGVGAIPLVPENINHYNDLELLASNIKNIFLEN